MKKGLVIGGSVLFGICIIIVLISLFLAFGFEFEVDNILYDTQTDGTIYFFEEGDSFVF
jgi:surface polysaccharide O-acyltransferase-like enzyme